MTPLASWHAEISRHATALHDAHPEHRAALAVIICHGHPCHPRPCTRCASRTCRACKRTAGLCPDHPCTMTPCLVCQILTAHPMALRGADMGDGLRSPDLLGAGGGGGGSQVEAAYDKRNDRGTVATYLDSRDEAARWLDTARSASDETARARQIGHARREAANALAALHKLLSRSTGEAPVDTSHKWCTSCQRVGTLNPVFIGHLCEWCYRWGNAEGCLPPLGVLEARAQGRRITTRVVDEATRAERSKAARPKRKKAKR